MTAIPADKEQAPASEGGASSSWTPSYAFLIVVTLLNLAADIVSKQWTKAHFEALKGVASRKIVVIDGVMNIIYAKNKGGAWGLLQGSVDALRRPFFLVVSVAAIVFIISLYRKLTPEQRALKWGLPLVLGGALGNLIDRVIYGFVIDFIDVYVVSGGREKHWPTFNVADIAICVGVGLMAIDMFTTKAPKKEVTQSPPDSDTDEAKADEASPFDQDGNLPSAGDATPISDRAPDSGTAASQDDVAPAGEAGNAAVDDALEPAPPPSTSDDELEASPDA